MTQKTDTQLAIEKIADGVSFLSQHIIELEQQVNLLLMPNAKPPLFCAGDPVVATDIDIGGIGIVDYVGKPTHLLPVFVVFENGHRAWFSSDGRRHMNGPIVLVHAPINDEVTE